MEVLAKVVDIAWDDVTPIFTLGSVKNLTWSDASSKLIFKCCGTFFDLCLMQCWVCMDRCWAVVMAWILNLK